jgi:hypothetical protein
MSAKLSLPLASVFEDFAPGAVTAGSVEGMTAAEEAKGVLAMCATDP